MKRTAIIALLMQYIIINAMGPDSFLDLFENVNTQNVGLTAHYSDIDQALQNVWAQNLSTQKFNDTYKQLLIENCPDVLKILLQRIEKGDCSRIPSKILLVGPSGSGKTSLAKLIAQKAKPEAYMIMGAAISNEYANSGAQNLLRVFSPLRDSNKKIAIVLDELTALTDKKFSNGKTNEDVGTVETFWQLLDGFSNDANVMIIATANNLDSVPVQIKTRFSGSTYTINNPAYHLRSKIIQYYLPEFVKFGRLQQYWFLYRTSQLSVREIEDILNNAQIFKSNESAPVCYSDLARALNHYNNNQHHYVFSVKTILQNNAYWLVPFVGGILLQQFYTYQNKCFQEQTAIKSQEFQVQLQDNMKKWQENMNTKSQEFQTNLHQENKTFQSDMQKKAFDHADKGKDWKERGIDVATNVVSQSIVLLIEYLCTAGNLNQK